MPLFSKKSLLKRRFLCRRFLCCRIASGVPKVTMMASPINLSIVPPKCKAAHQGHPEALWHQALDYWYGISPIAVDKVRGYIWTLIAMSFGVEDAASPLEERANQLTLDQIAEAERLAAEWQRNPTPCEAEVEIAVRARMKLARL